MDHCSAPCRSKKVSVLTLLAIQLSHRLLHAHRVRRRNTVIVDHAQQRWYLEVTDLRIELQDF